MMMMMMMMMPHVYICVYICVCGSDEAKTGSDEAKTDSEADNSDIMDFLRKRLQLDGTNGNCTPAILYQKNFELWEVVPSEDPWNIVQDVGALMPEVTRVDELEKLQLRLSQFAQQTFPEEENGFNIAAAFLGAPVVIITDTTRRLAWELYGQTSSELPLLLLRREAESHSDPPAYEVAFPMLAAYKTQYEAALRVVHYHPELVKIDDEKGDPFLCLAVFPVEPNEDGFWFALRLHQISRDPSFQEGGDNFAPHLTRLKVVPPELKQAVERLKRALNKSPQFRSGRKIAHSSDGGNAFDYTTFLSAVKRNLARVDFGISTKRLGAVLCDFGVGLGNDVFAQWLYSETVRAIGFEKEHFLHQSLLAVHAYLLSSTDWKGNVATRKQNSEELGSLEGVTNASLHDGARLNSKDPLRPNDPHVVIVRNIMRTDSIDELTTTKINDTDVMNRYCAIDEVIAEQVHKFFAVKLVNMPMATYKGGSMMFVKKKQYRAKRKTYAEMEKLFSDANARGEPRSLVRDMIIAADATKQTPDLYGKYSSCHSYPHMKMQAQKVEVHVINRETGHSSAADILVGCSLRSSLTGEDIWPHNGFRVSGPGGNPPWVGSFVGLQPAELSADVQGEQYALVSPDNSEILLVPTIYLKRHADADAAKTTFKSLHQLASSTPVYQYVVDRRTSKRLKLQQSAAAAHQTACQAAQQSDDHDAVSGSPDPSRLSQGTQEAGPVFTTPPPKKRARAGQASSGSDSKAEGERKRAKAQRQRERRASKKRNGGTPPGRTAKKPKTGNDGDPAAEDLSASGSEQHSNNPNFTNGVVLGEIRELGKSVATNATMQTKIDRSISTMANKMDNFAAHLKQQSKGDVYSKEIGKVWEGMQTTFEQLQPQVADISGAKAEIGSLEEKMTRYHESGEEKSKKIELQLAALSTQVQQQIDQRSQQEIQHALVTNIQTMIQTANETSANAAKAMRDELVNDAKAMREKLVNDAKAREEKLVNDAKAREEKLASILEDTKLNQLKQDIDSRLTEFGYKQEVASERQAAAMERHAASNAHTDLRNLHSMVKPAKGQTATVDGTQYALGTTGYGQRETGYEQREHAPGNGHGNAHGNGNGQYGSNNKRARKKKIKEEEKKAYEEQEEKKKKQEKDKEIGKQQQ